MRRKSNAYTHGNGNRNGYGHTHDNSHANAYGYSNTDAWTEAYPNTKASPDAAASAVTLADRSY